MVVLAVLVQSEIQQASGRSELRLVEVVVEGWVAVDNSDPGDNSVD